MSTVSPIRVVTANVRYHNPRDGAHAWPRRAPALLAHLRATDPDLLGVQEALAPQNDELTAALSRHATVGVGRDDGDRAGEFASLFVRRGRFAVVESGTFWLSQAPDVVGSISWDAALPRVCTWARLRDLENDRPLLFANTHLDHQGAIAREQSAELLVARLPELADGGAVVLTGDFNATADSAAYARLTATTFIDAYRAVHPIVSADEATFHGFAGTPRGTPIDFIFHSHHLQATDATIDRPRRADDLPLSDHDFVTASVRWS